MNIIWVFKQIYIYLFIKHQSNDLIQIIRLQFPLPALSNLIIFDPRRHLGSPVTWDDTLIVF